MAATATFSKTWIDRRLSGRERDALVDYLFERSDSPTGEEIVAAIAELFPEKTPPSVASALNWKNAAWNFERLQRRRKAIAELAQTVCKQTANIPDASARLLNGYVYAQIEKLENGDKDTDPHLRGWIAAANQLSRQVLEDRRLAAELEKSRAQVALLENELAEAKRRDAEREEAKKAAIEAVSADKGYTKQQREKVVQQFKLL